jgi:two-component system, response regulator PdtaR
MTASLRIAVADDERDMREYLQEVLPRLGHQVVAAADSGRQLVEQCRTAAPDLLITDIRMDGLDGIEAAAAVNRASPVPVILVSAHHDEELLARAKDDHVLAYLVKPVKEPDLKAAIAVAMQRFRQFQAVTKEAADMRQALEDRKLIERAKGAIMRRAHLAEDEAFRRLRKLASQRNLKLVDMARSVLAAEEVFHHLDDM